MKILKVYMGVTSGTLGGRDDGHPEMKSVLYNSIDDLAKNYGKQSKEQYFKLKEMTNEEVADLVRESLDKKKQNAKEIRKNEIEEEISKLQSELRELQ